jgi:integrase
MWYWSNAAGELRAAVDRFGERDPYLFLGQEGYGIATELAALRRAFILAVKARRISERSQIALLAEHNIRQGFVEPAEFEVLVAHLPDPRDDLARFAYAAGWRKSECLTLAWTDVDRARGLVTLRREHSKTEQPRLLPLTPGLAGSLTVAIRRGR